MFFVWFRLRNLLELFSYFVQNINFWSFYGFSEVRKREKFKIFWKIDKFMVSSTILQIFIGKPHKIFLTRTQIAQFKKWYSLFSIPKENISDFWTHHISQEVYYMHWHSSNQHDYEVQFSFLLGISWFFIFMLIQRKRSDKWKFSIFILLHIIFGVDACSYQAIPMIIVWGWQAWIFCLLKSNFVCCV